MELQGFKPESKYFIINIAGKTIKEGKIGETKTHIDTKNLETGEYILKVFSGGVVYTIKISRG